MKVAIWVITSLGLVPVGLLGAYNVVISLQLSHWFQRELEEGALLKHVAFLRAGRVQIDFIPNLGAGVMALIGVAAIIISLILMRPH
jgi:hypothetical protein